MHPLSRFRKECKARRLRWLDVITVDDNDAPRKPRLRKSGDSERTLVMTDSGRLTSVS